MPGAEAADRHHQSRYAKGDRDTRHKSTSFDRPSVLPAACSQQRY